MKFYLLERNFFFSHKGIFERLILSGIYMKIEMKFLKKKLLQIFFCALIILFSVSSVFSKCVYDDRTITELLFRDFHGTIFTCKILSDTKKQNGYWLTRAKITEVFFGKVDSQIVNLNSNYISSQYGRFLKTGQQLLIFTQSYGVNRFDCCNECDKWFKEIDSPGVKNEIKIIKQFAEIFREKKTGEYIFYYDKKIIAARGSFKDGTANGDWMHFYKNGYTKSWIIDFETNYFIKYNDHGFNEYFHWETKDSITEVFLSEKVLLLKQTTPYEKKIVTYPNDSGKITTTYEYSDSATLIKISSKIRINQKQGGYFEGYTGNYREYFESGKLHLAGQYKMNKRVGVWKWYDETGNETAEYDYKDGAGKQ